MRKKIYSIVLCAALVSLLLTVGGCSRKEVSTEPVALAIVTLNGANMPSVNVDDVREYVEKAAGVDGSEVSVVIADGNTHLAENTIKYGERVSKNKPHWKKEFKERCDVVYKALQMEASYEETDLIGSIDYAVRQLNASGISDQVLVIVHSGITTTAPFPMQDYDLEYIDVESVVEELKSMNAISDLSEVREIQWYYLNDTAGEQHALSSVQESVIKEFWTLYFQEARFKGKLTFRSNVPANDEIASAPYVAVVDTNEQRVTPVRLPDKEEVVSLDKTIVRFAPDSYELADSEAAKEYLSDIAKGLCDNPQKSCVLAGSTADTPDSTIESSCTFGLRRAEQIKWLLVSMGVHENQLEVIGVGIVQTSVRSDIDEENRTVWLTDANSSLAKEFRDVGMTNG